MSGLEVEVPQHVRDYQVSLVKALHELLDALLVDNVDDFILSLAGPRFPVPPMDTPHRRGPPQVEGSRTLGHQAVGGGMRSIADRNRQFLPGPDAGEGLRDQDLGLPGDRWAAMTVRSAGILLYRRGAADGTWRCG